MTLSFADLKAKSEEKAKAKGLPFIAKDDKELLIRPFMQLSKDEIKNILLHLDKVNAKDGDVAEKIDSVDHILVCAADRKKAMKDSLEALDTDSRMEILDAWMKAADVPEASASTS